ncbi:hypothetical protein [Microcoleus asticus]|uniref:Uncharacterized protein n=1 Tax=Microcoleus asticus IPMA8 TaxID=2563858 RepID=A0ABX2D029_9CYAN|nr:hypothetical protein [Microcoleus asticus]NQE35205.1 hypothetical protein [Microcoleus asticus IPMA8]
MTTKELLEIIGFFVGIASGAAAGGFAFASYKYSLEIKDLQRQIKNDTDKANNETLKNVTKYGSDIRKLQQNHDNLLNQVGTLKCDVRDNKAILEREGFIHPRAGYPEEFIPNRTDWGAIEDA